MKVKEEARLKLNIRKTKILASGPNTSWKIGGETIETGEKKKKRETLFSWAPKSLRMVTAAMKLKDTFWKKSYDKPRQHVKKQRRYFVDKGLYKSKLWFFQ